MNTVSNTQGKPQPSPSRKRLYQWIDAYVAARALLGDQDSMPAEARTALRTVMQKSESLFSLLEMHDSTKELLGCPSIEADNRKTLADLDRINAEHLRVDYGVSIDDYYSFKQWRKRDYVNHVRFQNPLYGSPLMEDPGDTYMVWCDRKDPGDKGEKETKDGIRHALKQIRSGERAVLEPGKQTPMELAGARMPRLEQLMMNVTVTMEFRGITRIPDYKFASEIWVDGIAMAPGVLDSV
jgi:hypothetical protein